MQNHARNSGKGGTFLLCLILELILALIAKRVVLSGGETTGPLRPEGYIGHPRFHITPDHTLSILCNLVGTTPETKAQTGTYAMRIEADGSFSARVRIPLARPIPGEFFTATPRAGNRLSEAADLLIAHTVDGKPAARYARIRFCRSDSQNTARRTDLQTSDMWVRAYPKTGTGTLPSGACPGFRIGSKALRPDSDNVERENVTATMSDWKAGRTP